MALYRYGNAVSRTEQLNELETINMDSILVNSFYFKYMHYTKKCVSLYITNIYFFNSNNCSSEVKTN